MGVGTTIETISMAYDPGDSIFIHAFSSAAILAVVIRTVHLCILLLVLIFVVVVTVTLTLLLNFSMADHHQHNASCIADFKRRYCIFPSITSHHQILKLKYFPFSTTREFPPYYNHSAALK